MFELLTSMDIQHSIINQFPNNSDSRHRMCLKTEHKSSDFRQVQVPDIKISDIYCTVNVLKPDLFKIWTFINVCGFQDLKLVLTVFHICTFSGLPKSESSKCGKVVSNYINT